MLVPARCHLILLFVCVHLSFVQKSGIPLVLKRVVSISNYIRTEDGILSVFVRSVACMDSKLSGARSTIRVLGINLI